PARASVVLIQSRIKLQFCVTGATGVVHQGAYLITARSKSSTRQPWKSWWRLKRVAGIYPRYLAGQSLDIASLPDGTYWLVVTAGPDNLLDEGEDGVKGWNPTVFRRENSSLPNT